MVPPMSMIDDIISFAKCGPKSIALNSIIDTKITMKKMIFGPSKCHNLHIGHNTERCPTLKVQGNNVNQKNHSTYLGDELSSDGSNDLTISSRRGQGIGAISQILALVDQ